MTGIVKATSGKDDEQEPKKVVDDGKAIIDPENVKALYKIEVHFGKDRTTIGLCTCAILIWESGKRFHGGGDEKMYWCGYKDCQKPIRSSGFAQYHVVCPHCQRECFLDPQGKAQHIRELKHRGEHLNNIERLPIISGEKLMKAPARSIAEFMTKIWYDLECDADIYLKYHPSDIRFNIKSGGEVAIIDQMDTARSSRGMMIYPLKNILKDISAGAEVTRRFFSMITA